MANPFERANQTEYVNSMEDRGHEELEARRKELKKILLTHGNGKLDLTRDRLSMDIENAVANLNDILERLEPHRLLLREPRELEMIRPSIDEAHIFIMEEIRKQAAGYMRFSEWQMDKLEELVKAKLELDNKQIEIDNFRRTLKGLRTDKQWIEHYTRALEGKPAQEIPDEMKQDFEYFDHLMRSWARAIETYDVALRELELRDGESIKDRMIIPGEGEFDRTNKNEKSDYGKTR